MFVDDRAGKFGEIELRRFERIASGFEIGEFQNVADLGMQSTARHADIARVFDIFRIADRAEHAALDDLGEPDHGVQWRAQFVAHMGDELGLASACASIASRSACASRTRSRASSGFVERNALTAAIALARRSNSPTNRRGETRADQRWPQDDEQIERQGTVPGAERARVVRGDGDDRRASR